MGIDAEHLAEDGLTCLEEILGETASLANPFLARFRQGRAESRVIGVGDARRVGRENGRIINLARDVPLDQAEIFVGRNLDGLESRVQPGEGMVAIRNQLYESSS